MKLDDYQNRSVSTAIYPGMGSVNGLLYCFLGLAGEAGEVAEHGKKMLRDDDGILTTERKEKVKGELGDLLWYVAMTAKEADLTLGEVAQGNLDKLADRKERGVLHGSGSER